MSPSLLPYADPDLVATVERLVAAGEPERVVEAAKRYVEADAGMTKLLREALA